MLDIHDGELLPTLENRRTITRKIREWKADVVIAHRPNDYHPDHRYTGILVQDAAFMVIVPSFCPDVPALRKNPVFLYSRGRLQEAQPVRARRRGADRPGARPEGRGIDALESQFYEWNPWLFGYLDQVPKGKAERLEWTRKRVARALRRDRRPVPRASWSSCSGEEKGKAVKYAEAFEVCEYGTPAVDERAAAALPVLRRQVIERRGNTGPAPRAGPARRSVVRGAGSPGRAGSGAAEPVVARISRSAAGRRRRGRRAAAAAEVVLVDVDDLDPVIDVVERDRVVGPVQLVVVDRALVVAVDELAGAGQRIDLARVDLLADLLDQEPDVVALGLVERRASRS